MREPLPLLHRETQWSLFLFVSWLDDIKNKERLYNMRLSYVLKPDAEDVVKFGIAGLDRRSGGWARLYQYINEYGFATDLKII